MTEEEVQRFADVMMMKAALHGFVHGRYGWGENPEDALRGLIVNVIVDTELLVNGEAPLSRWLKESPA